MKPTDILSLRPVMLSAGLEVITESSFTKPTSYFSTQTNVLLILSGEDTAGAPLAIVWGGRKEMGYRRRRWAR